MFFVPYLEGLTMGSLQFSTVPRIPMGVEVRFANGRYQDGVLILTVPISWRASRSVVIVYAV